MLGAKIVARAKINLYLSVGPRRGDGFHEIQSVMQTLELSDELYFRRTAPGAERIAIRCSNKNVPVDERNIVWSAVESFDRRTGAMLGDGLEIFINKRIPVGAGLAGGSADAAATLLALDSIWELDLPREALLEMAEEVGSDVPFCLVGGTALAEGRGERLTTLKPLPPYRVVLVSSDREVSTGEVYDRFDKLEESERKAFEQDGGKREKMLEAIDRQDFEAVCANLRNDLESVADEESKVAEVRDAILEAGAEAASMTGSGPTVFALVPGLEEAAEVAWALGKLAPVTIITNFADKGAEISR